MKPVKFSFFFLCLLAGCNSATTSADSSKDSSAASSSTENVTYAYTPTYSADFEIGDSKYIATVLDLWKDYDDNTFDKHIDAFADSVQINLSGGTIVRGTRDSVINSVKAYRSSFPTSVSSVDAAVAIKAKGKDETWVCVWGKEVDTRKDNSSDSILYNENWLFNKDGKIVYMEQFEAKPPALPKK